MIYLRLMIQSVDTSFTSKVGLNHPYENLLLLFARLLIYAIRISEIYSL